MNHVHMQLDLRGNPKQLSVNGVMLKGAVNFSNILDRNGRIVGVQLQLYDYSYTVGKDAPPSPWPWLEQFKQQIGRPS